MIRDKLGCTKGKAAVKIVQTRVSRLPLLLLLLIVLGGGLRLAALNEAGRLHSDEAYFAGFARRAVIHGDWRLTGDLDKPPLTIYAAALVMTAVAHRTPDGVLDLDMRAGEIAARLPGVLFGTLWIAIMIALARLLYPLQRGIGAWVGLLAAASPLAIGFSAAAFTDAGLLLAITAAAYGAAARRPGWTAGALAIAVGCKLQAVYALPLIGLLALAVDPRPWQLIGAALLGTAAGLLGVVLWDGLRGGAVPLLSLAAERNDPSRLIRPDEVEPRLRLWLEYGRGLFGAPSAVLVLAACGTGLLALVRRSTYARRVDLALLAYALGYVVVHGLIAFNVYDRYLLPLLLVLIPLAARGVLGIYTALAKRLSSGEALVIVGVLGLTALTSGLAAARGDLPYRIDDSSFDRPAGIDRLAAAIDAAPLGTIVYDRWLGWELSYYLSAWTDKRRVYYPTPADLLAGAQAQPDPAPRLFIAPADRPLRLWLEPLAAAGFSVTTALSVPGYAVYWLLPPSSSAESSGFAD